MRPTLFVLTGICLYFATNKRTNARYLLLKIEEKEEFPKQDFQYENGTHWPINGRNLVANHRNRHLVNHDSCGLSKVRNDFLRNKIVIILHEIYLHYAKATAYLCWLT